MIEGCLQITVVVTGNITEIHGAKHPVLIPYIPIIEFLCRKHGRVK